jgi:hypothetical protein
MTQQRESRIGSDYHNVDKNQDLVLKLFLSYYRAHINSGKLLDDAPGYFLAKPDVLNGLDIATRGSDKLIMADCIQRAQSRQGYISISKQYNPKLKYYWLELGVAPFTIGDAVTDNNKSEFFYVLSNFIGYTQSNPNIYGDITAEISSDKDLDLMLKEIHKLGSSLRGLRPMYPEAMLVSFNPNWPVTEVNKLMKSLKGNDQSWCEVFFEYLIYVMSRKGKEIKK